MRGKIFGYVAFVLCGIAIYLTGYAFGEFKKHNSVSKMYFQGYRTGYIKGFRRVKKEVYRQSAIEVSPLNLNRNQRVETPVAKYASQAIPDQTSSISSRD